MKRLEAIRNIMDTVTDELVVATTGMISREVFVAKDRPENFYMCGSMGCALSIGRRYDATVTVPTLALLPAIDS